MPWKQRDPARTDAPDARPPRRHVVLRRVLWSLFALVLVAALGAGAAAARFVRDVSRTAPAAPKLHELQAARPSVLVSADGQVLTTFVRAQQEPVPLSKVSPHVKQALLDTEDRRFYEHRGVDPKRTLAAAWRTFHGDTQGGSTITQQLARNLFPEEIGRSRTITRKVKEWVTALRIERAYTKDQILEYYLNSAPFLYNAIGIEMAARTYYGKSAADLDVLESATLVGMLKGTRSYNPVLNPERAQSRRNVVLRQMMKGGHLAPEAYERLRTQPLKVSLNRPPESPGPAPHFAVHARRWLAAWAEQNRYDLYADGLRIESTIDTRLQEAALRAVERQAGALQAVADVEWSAPSARVLSISTDAYERRRPKVEPFAHFWSRQRDLVAAFVRESAAFKDAVARHGSETAALHALMADAEFMAQLKREKTRLEAGLVAIEPDTGEVKAWVGSRDFQVDQYDHVAQAARQPGSTFKAFVYAAALEAGLDPDRDYVDGPLEVRLADGNVWRPADMTEPTGEPLPMREGLVLSKNTITAQVALDVGVPRIVSVAQAMGVEQSRLDPVPSLALGTSPVTLLEMTAGYATIARQGEYRRPLTIRRI
ncbi:MAG TPA: transglycosylase domain-containing protein, partial [Albitalea sp.]